MGFRSKDVKKVALETSIQYYRHCPFGVPPLSPGLLDYPVMLGYLEGR